MPVKFVNLIETAIADVGGISDSATTINITTGDGAKLPALTGSDYMYAIITDATSTWECVKVTARSADELTVDRNIDGTNQAWAEDDVMYFPATKDAFEDIRAEITTLEDRIPSGTIMLFGQASAPTGWTKKTDWQTNAMLTLNSEANGTALDSGGSTNPQSITISVPSHYHGKGNLSIGSSGSHTHSIWRAQDAESGTARNRMYSSDQGDGTTDTNSASHTHTSGDFSGSVGNTGGSDGDSAFNATTFSPYYQELIAATKD